MITISTSFLQRDNGKVTKLQYLCLFFSYLFSGFRMNSNSEKQSMRDDIRKTKTILLTMVDEKLLLHGGVNGLVSDVNYQL